MILNKLDEGEREDCCKDFGCDWIIVGELRQKLRQGACRVTPGQYGVPWKAPVYIVLLEVWDYHICPSSHQHLMCLEYIPVHYSMPSAYKTKHVSAKC